MSEEEKDKRVQPLYEIRDLVSNNALATTFQSLGQYRTMLIKEIDIRIAKLQEEDNE